jgi:hypothetical protein
VHAITRYKEFEHWKSFIQDRKVYVLYNCQVYDNELGLKPCEGPFKVVFGSGTNIKPAPEITNIPDQDFWFKNFKEANDGTSKLMFYMVRLFYKLAFQSCFFLIIKLHSF